MNSIPVLGTEPASENRIRSCCGSMPGIRFYCKPVTLVRCWEIRGENRFSGRVGGKWLCEMTSAFIIKELRGALALRLFCGRSSFPPPDKNPIESIEVQNPPFLVGFLLPDRQTTEGRNRCRGTASAAPPGRATWSEPTGDQEDT